jgi:nucleotide-binding universal stress UspA family protein
MSEANAVSAIPTKILVPIDFSPSSHVALETAMEMAQKFNAELLLLHVIPETCSTEESKATAEKHFALSQASLDAKGIKGATLIEVENDVAGNILEAAERENVNLVVISTHGVSGWYPVVFGSIAEKIVKLMHTPILLLRTEKPETSAKVSSAGLMEWW